MDQHLVFAKSSTIMREKDQSRYPSARLPFILSRKKKLHACLKQVKGILTVEMSAGQMVEDVRLNVANNIPVEHYGRFGGVIPTPEEIVEALEKQIIGA